MAETLGSLIDKLTIKDLREFHIRQMLEAGDRKYSAAELKAKLKTLAAQKKALTAEIDGFVAAACTGKMLLKDEKLKLYNPKENVGRIPLLTKLGEAISCLANKNSELWHLEDEARRIDVPLSEIGAVKRRIDLANQQRNDLMDRIDSIFESMVTAERHGRKKA